MQQQAEMAKETGTLLIQLTRYVSLSKYSTENCVTRTRLLIETLMYNIDKDLIF